MAEPKQCSRGCGQLIYFSEEHKSPKGKFIPMEVDVEGKETAKSHECPNNPYSGGGGQQQVLNNDSSNKRIADLEARVSALEDK
jgi:hypothetical protein